MEEQKWIIVFILGGLLLGCKSPYMVSDFERQTQDHETIAVLPFEMIFTGVIPDGLSEDEVLNIEEAESKAFQVSFYNEILHSAQRRKGNLSIDIQDYRETWRLLKEHQIELRDSWTESAESLADILDVDAVVRARITKHRYMTDLESFGIELGLHILDELHRHHTGVWWLYGFSASKQIQSHYTLLDADGGRVLWSIAFDQEANWSLSSNEIIEEINRRAARQFPYRSQYGKSYAGY